MYYMELYGGCIGFVFGLSRDYVPSFPTQHQQVGMLKRLEVTG